MLKFCFPERDPETIEETNIEYEDTISTTGSLKQEKGSSKKNKNKKLGKDTNFYVKIEDDVEKMKVILFTVEEYLNFFNFIICFNYRKELKKTNSLYISKYRNCLCLLVIKATKIKI